MNNEKVDLEFTVFLEGYTQVKYGVPKNVIREGLESIEEYLNKNVHDFQIASNIQYFDESINLDSDVLKNELLDQLYEE